jgi:hypothetical protein
MRVRGIRSKFWATRIIQIRLMLRIISNKPNEIITRCILQKPWKEEAEGIQAVCEEERQR